MFKILIAVMLIFQNIGFAQNDKIYQNDEVDELPEPMEGIEKYIQKIESKIKYPKQALDIKVDGDVLVLFDIMQDGKVKNIRIMRGIGAGCDEAAYRAVKDDSDWKAGKKDGQNVNVTMKMWICYQYTDMKTGKPSVNANLGNKKEKGEMEPLPLFVLDGVPLDAEKDKSLMESLNPNDIETIEILKDEAAIKIYGEKGKNGVVLIKTKKKN